MSLDWLFPVFQFYFFTFILGIIFFPLTKKIFSSFSLDFGYPFAKILAIIFLSYFIYVFSFLKILSFNQPSLFFLLIVFFIVNFFLFKKKPQKEKKLEIKNWSFFILEEVLFFLSFLFLSFIRSQEPSIRSLEKFMDFGFINSILKTKYFPPKDIWYTPLPINYYYFGHLTGATLIKLTNVLPSLGYNLVLANIFALAVTSSFSFISNLIYFFDKKISFLRSIFFGLVGAYILNLGGNLHTIYLFTKGYPNDNPIPFWQIFSGFNPQNYWYPNATRFIPFTIHEFPSYSYVVADLHGHVFDIPFVLLTLSLLFLFFYQINLISYKKQSKSLLRTLKKISKLQWLTPVFIGFLISIHYMTNAFDGPIYFLLFIFLLFFIYGISFSFFISFILTFFSFLIFSFPFSSHFQPFVSGIGVNCAPDFLTNIGKIGLFLFEKGNCQISPLWMLFVLWGFFLINFIIFSFFTFKQNDSLFFKTKLIINHFILILFVFGFFLILIPEFFYIKDIYPQHFRANTMFKLGYQAFIMMSLTSTFVFYLIKNQKKTTKNYLLIFVYLCLLLLVFIYPFFAFPSYYSKLDRQPNLDGSFWLNEDYPQDKEIINWLNKNVSGQPVILEAQGDSYTDYERISVYTGLPTVAGWWVHEWLWRGSSDVVGQRIPDIINIYQSKDLKLTKELIKKYQIKYIIVSQLEKEKYPNLYEEKFSQIGNLVFRSTNKLGAIYQVN